MKMQRLFYIRSSGEIVTSTGRVMDKAGTFSAATQNYPWPIVFMGCDDWDDFGRVRDVAEPNVRALCGILGIVY